MKRQRTKKKSKILISEIEKNDANMVAINERYQPTESVGILSPNNAANRAAIQINANSMEFEDPHGSQEAFQMPR